MKVEVRLFATLAAFLPPEARPGGFTVVDVPSDSTVAGLASVLGISGNVARVTLVNDSEATDGHPLAPGDVVTLQVYNPRAGGERVVRNFLRPCHCLASPKRGSTHTARLRIAFW